MSSRLLFFSRLERLSTRLSLAGGGPMRLEDIMDGDYDKMESPKEGGEATKVTLRVTLLSLDTIDEISMVGATLRNPSNVKWTLL